MGKEIKLPWTCEIGDKIKNIIHWGILITAPISLIIMGLVIWNNTSIPWFIGMGLAVYGTIGSLFGWLTKFIEWDLNGDLPYFSCKCDTKSEGSQS